MDFYGALQHLYQLYQFKSLVMTCDKLSFGMMTLYSPVTRHGKPRAMPVANRSLFFCTAFGSLIDFLGRGDPA